MHRLAPRMNVLFWGRHDFQISFANRDTSRNATNRHGRSFMVDTGILSTNMKFTSHECLKKWHSVSWPNTMTTLRRPDYTNPWPFYRTRSFTELREVSIGNLRRVRHAHRRRLLVRTPGPVPFGTCICSTCCDQFFSRTYVIFPDYAIRKPLGTFSILPLTNHWLIFRFFSVTSCYFSEIVTGKHDTENWSEMVSLCENKSRNKEYDCIYCQNA